MIVLSELGRRTYPIERARLIMSAAMGFATAIVAPRSGHVKNDMASDVKRTFNVGSSVSMAAAGLAHRTRSV